MSVLSTVSALFLAAIPAPAVAQPSALRVGEAQVQLAPKGNDARLPAAPFRTEAMRARAAPTSQWYSTLVFSPQPHPIYAQPLSVRPVAQGLELSLPLKEVRPTPRRDTEIAYPHRDPVLLSPTAFEPGKAQLAAADDWSFEMSMASGSDDMRATVAHGSPYVFLRISRRTGNAWTRRTTLGGWR